MPPSIVPAMAHTPEQLDCRTHLFRADLNLVNP
jgi:hypothetical protein